MAGDYLANMPCIPQKGPGPGCLGGEPCGVGQSFDIEWGRYKGSLMLSFVGDPERLCSRVAVQPFKHATLYPSALDCLTACPFGKGVATDLLTTFLSLWIGEK
jgi:hypothetical protein